MSLIYCTKSVIVNILKARGTRMSKSANMQTGQTQDLAAKLIDIAYISEFLTIAFKSA